MQTIRCLTLLCGLIPGVGGPALAAAPGLSSGDMRTALVLDAKLVYGEELAAFESAPSQQQGPWPRHMPRSIDAFASGNEVVLGILNKACDSPSTEGYARSGCDGQWMMVVELAALPATDESLELGDARLLAVGMFHGDRHAGARSGCLGYPSMGTLKVTERFGDRIRIRIDFEFKLLEHARYPAECGRQRVEGDFEFIELSTDEIATGGLDKLF